MCQKKGKGNVVGGGKNRAGRQITGERVGRTKGKRFEVGENRLKKTHHRVKKGTPTGFWEKNGFKGSRDVGKLRRLS